MHDAIACTNCDAKSVPRPGRLCVCPYGRTHGVGVGADPIAAGLDADLLGPIGGRR
jgi:hypothetical protein